MKKFIFSLAVILGVGGATLAPTTQAQAVTETENYKITTYTQEELARVWVYVNKAAGTNFSLELKDAKGNVLYSDYVKHRKIEYAFKIDMSQLGNGTYYLETSDGKTPICKTLRKEEISVSQPAVAQRLVAMN